MGADRWRRTRQGSKLPALAWSYAGLVSIGLVPLVWGNLMFLLVHRRDETSSSGLILCSAMPLRKVRKQSTSTFSTTSASSIERPLTASTCSAPSPLKIKRPSWTSSSNLGILCTISRNSLCARGSLPCAPASSRLCTSIAPVLSRSVKRLAWPPSCTSYSLSSWSTIAITIACTSSIVASRCPVASCAPSLCLGDLLADSGSTRPERPSILDAILLGAALTGSPAAADSFKTVSILGRATKLAFPAHTPPNAGHSSVIGPSVCTVSVTVSAWWPSGSLTTTWHVHS